MVKNSIAELIRRGEEAERLKGPCPARKCGEYNMLRCCDTAGHGGEHCFVVDHDNDYEFNKAPR